jgi:predicted metal-dependent peptidase
MTPQDRVTKSHIAIMRSKEFCLFSGVLSIGDVNFSDKVPTAGTNGRDVTYNPDWIQTLPTKELNFIVLHEAIHKAFQHMHIWKDLFKKNPMLTNMAADYVVNATIKNADPDENIAAMPKSGLYDQRFDNMTTKQIFDILQKENPQSDGVTVVLDEHGFDEAEALDDNEVKKVKEQIDQALRQGEILRGKMAGNQIRGVTDFLKPKVDWRRELRQFVNSICKSKDKSSWRKPHRRYVSQDIYMPSMIGESVGDIVIGVDTSGSIGQEEINLFLSEIVSICEDVTPKSVVLVYWDHEVAGVEQYKEGEYQRLKATTKPRGGGGTHVGCLNEYIRSEKLKPETTIVFTDGYVEQDWGGVWTCPTLWVVTSDLTSPHGKTIKYEGD